MCAIRRRSRFQEASAAASRFARALATHPSYILLDEPLAGIDPIAVTEIRNLVRHLKDRGIGVLITDHNVRDALDIIDRAYIIHEGQVLKEGLPGEIVAIATCAGFISANGSHFSERPGARTCHGADATAGAPPRPDARMTPQLQQAIKLLQLSNLDLAAYVEQELERNPLLERDESADGAAEPQETADAPASDGEPLDTALAREISRRPRSWTRNARMCSPKTRRPPIGAPLADWTTLRASPLPGGDENGIERVLARSATLQDHLLEQLSIAGLDVTRRLIAIALIDAIDEAGYLRVEAGDIATRLGATCEDVESVLRVVQGFEPTGVGARNLSECLALQLRERGRLDPAMNVLVSHLDLVARRDIAGLCRHCAVDAEDVSDMIAELRALTPKPGLAFGSEPVQPVVPDVFVREAPDGGWHVELNADTLPRLLVSARYYAKVAARARDKDAKTYLTNVSTAPTGL